LNIRGTRKILTVSSENADEKNQRNALDKAGYRAEEIV